jgi:hypothetical protein
MTIGPSAQFSVRLSSGQEFGPASLELIEHWAREGRIPVDALLVPVDGSAVRSVMAEPGLRSVLQASLMAAAAPPTEQGLVKADDSAAGVMIPYKNPAALTGYYLAVASLIPGLGAVLGPVAVGVGIAGLRKRMKHPEVHGIAHAWVAIILGGICSIGYILLIVLAFVAVNR